MYASTARCPVSSAGVTTAPNPTAGLPTQEPPCFVQLRSPTRTTFGVAFALRSFTWMILSAGSEHPVTAITDRTANVSRSFMAGRLSAAWLSGNQAVRSHRSATRSVCCLDSVQGAATCPPLQAAEQFNSATILRHGVQCGFVTRLLQALAQVTLWTTLRFMPGR